LASIDECLMAAFEHCGDSIDIEHELVEVQSEEPNLDKWPQWIDGASVALKTTVGKVMAREGVPSSARWSLTNRGHQTLLQFVLENGEHTEGRLLDHPFPFRDPLASVRMHMANQRRLSERLDRQLAEVDTINRENRERQEQLLRHAGVPLQTMPSMPGPPLAVGRQPVSSNVGPRPDCLGLPPGKQVPELLPSNRSGSMPSSLVGPGSLSLPVLFRHYMAGLGRFLTAARLQEQIEGEHPYGYALNNPMTYTDPSGMQVGVAPPTGYPFPPTWFPPAPSPVRPPLPVPPVQGCIILCGVEACYELCTYTPGHPTGPFTYLGDCVGQWLFPGENESPAPMPIPKPPRRKPPRPGCSNPCPEPCYRLDRVPPSRPHYPCPGDHIVWQIWDQAPDCKCYPRWDGPHCWPQGGAPPQRIKPCPSRSGR
jgi:hypothetical protein